MKRNPRKRFRRPSREMKVTFFSIIIAIQGLATCAAITVAERLNAVVARYPTAQNLYLRMRKANENSGNAYSKLRKTAKLDPETKNRICLSIMGSREYTRSSVKPVDMYHDDIYERVKAMQPNTFDKLYKFVEGDRAVYTNPTRPMDVFVGENEEPFSENVFICVNEWERIYDGIKFREYFVSEEYNMNDASDADWKHVGGRFVFLVRETDTVVLEGEVSEPPAQQGDDRRGTKRRAETSSSEHPLPPKKRPNIPQSPVQDKNDRVLLEVNGVAEEPAKVSLVTAVDWANWESAVAAVSSSRGTFSPKYMDVESLYLQRRKGNEPAREYTDDPLCKLNDYERFRLCGLIFNSEYFEGKVKVPASFSMVDGFGCRKNRVSFRIKDFSSETDENVYGEWMIICYMSVLPFNYRTEPKNVYFLSRAYNESINALRSNDVFVYELEYHSEIRSARVVLVNAFTDIRI